MTALSRVDGCVCLSAASVEMAPRFRNRRAFESILLVLFGLLRSGLVKLRKSDGWAEMERIAKAA